MKRFITLITLVGAVAALVVPVAGARLDSGNANSAGPLDPWTLHLLARQASDDTPPAASFYTPQALKADGARWQAMADSQSAAGFYTPQALKADALRWEAIAESYGVSMGSGVKTGSYPTANGLHTLATQLDAARHQFTSGGGTVTSTWFGPGGQERWAAQLNQLATSSSVTDTGGGFPIENVGIGVGGFFALLLAAGLVAMTRRSRHQQPAHA